MARLYETGAFVSIDKLNRVPPLDAPLDPNLFGDASELQRGNVTRKVKMRVSLIDEKTLKEIDKCRQGLRVLLTKFTFSLADNMRWLAVAVNAVAAEAGLSVGSLYQYFPNKDAILRALITSFEDATNKAILQAMRALSG